MDLLSTLRIAIRALVRNKMRSILTMLGIIIGVGAVVATVGLGQGARQQVQAQIAAMGSNMLQIGSGTVNRGGLRTGWGGTKTLVYSDVEAIRRDIPTVRLASGMVRATGQVVYGNENWSTSIQGAEPEFFEVRSWPVAQGTIFTPDEVLLASNVAVLGDTVKQNLFGAANAVGQTVRIGNLPFKVVGVLAPKGQSASMGQDQDDTIIVPFTTVQRKISGNTWLNSVMVSAVSADATFTAQRQIEELLRDRHRIRPGQDDDFFVRNLTEFAEAQDNAGRIMTLLLASVASVSLMVGGIGIMNIMLVSVTERTREIGIRMAIGATEEDVQRQFLIEAVVLSLLGGAMGILFGVAASKVITQQFSWPVLIAPESIAIAVAFSVAVGVFFGYYPARKAAKLDPIEALRYE